MLAANVFWLLMVYYSMKPVREALIAAEGVAEVSAYAAARRSESYVREPRGAKEPFIKNVPIPAASFKILFYLTGKIAS